ncbi:hypothetical protein D5086_009475 [Populus alba]|uniref:Uncharacterized protein n=1 Tax=Populus alba TaxID=43335 RepID=A0ACC4CIT9_POPAL
MREGVIGNLPGFLPVIDIGYLSIFENLRTVMDPDMLDRLEKNITRISFPSIRNKLSQISLQHFFPFKNGDSEAS